MCTPLWRLLSTSHKSETCYCFGREPKKNFNIRMKKTISTMLLLFTFMFYNKIIYLLLSLTFNFFVQINCCPCSFINSISNKIIYCFRPEFFHKHCKGSAHVHHLQQVLHPGEQREAPHHQPAHGGPNRGVVLWYLWKSFQEPTVYERSHENKA